MTDIELVIKIPAELYEAYKGRPPMLGDAGMDMIAQSIASGMPLPKGHGRLGDLDALETEMVNGIHAGNYEEGYETFAHINNMDDCVDCVRYADTIIEADKHTHAKEESKSMDDDLER